MPKIKSLKARQILDSRGNPTVEVDCELDDGNFGRAAVPSGASTGTHEALELRDGDKKMYGGKSVRKAVGNVSEIAKELTGQEVSDHRALDQKMLDMDGTPNKSKLGANAILGVSMAVCRARAGSEGKPLCESLAGQFGVDNPNLLPVPMMNVMNGGTHADSGLAIQECMIVPTGFNSFTDALRAGAETFHALKKLLKDAGHVTAVGDEGGFAPRVKDTDEAFGFIMDAIKKAGYDGKIQLAIDAAASEFYEGGSYAVDGKQLSSEELTAFYIDLTERYPMVSIEDSHSEDDWDGFTALTSALGDKMQFVGDDLLVTNVDRIKEAIEKKAVNSVLIKLNQIGSVSETVDAINLTHEQGWTSVVSHRSGETEDTFIAHLAVGLRTGQIKTGSLSRTDRVCKYNQLLRIEEHLGSKAEYKSPF
ncbi:MAG: phosphopyruvate hydratase [Candidatus Peribacteraceae bacterium]|jgi:enolase|nr:phosphopyruvate hydratase [Candidatus Peribacteraceae bacterium]MDP7454475.1 phosphopyruvate hydratase [Candidatus Peribacteraceae bacterium]MDP7646236.1 phosphopyruvate hydratase [Candidatus Peribacteraceae bacterium]